MTSQPNERSGGRGSYATWRRPATWRNQRLTWFQLALFWSTTRSAKCRLSWRSDSRRLSASLFIQWGRDTTVLRATARPDITFRRNEGVRIALRLRAGGDASEVADRVQNVSKTQGEPRGIARTPVDLYQPLTHCGSSVCCRQKSRAITNLGTLVNRFRPRSPLQQPFRRLSASIHDGPLG